MHWVTVVGWRVNDGKLQFHTLDPYRNINTGWYDVNMNYTKLKNGTGYAAGYNVYCLIVHWEVL